MKISEKQRQLNDHLRGRLEMNRSMGSHEIKYEKFVFSVAEQVFSPAVFMGWKYYTPLLAAMNLSGKRFLEIGCGCGFTGLYLAATQNLKQLVLADINSHAVENAKANAKSLGLNTAITFYNSDVFDGIPRAAFDIVYWNHPWEQEIVGYRHQDELEKGLFDGGYAALAKFLEDLGDFMEPSGRAFLGMGTSADLQLFYELCHKHGLHPYEISAPGKKSPGYILYEICKTPSPPPRLFWMLTIFRRKYLQV